MATMTDYKLRRVPISDLKLAPYNPKRRLNDVKMRSLQKSIEATGLIYPIAINEKNEVIDGHRRIEACKRLGWDEIPVLTVVGVRESIYADVNANACRMNGNDHLNIYLMAPNALPVRTQKYLESVEAVIGRQLMQRMAKHGASVTYYRWASEIAAYCERADDPDFLKRTITWFLQHKCSKIAINAIKSGVSAKTIERAIQKNLRLTSSYRAVTA